MNKTILLAQGSGGRLSHELIEKVLVPAIANPLLEQMDDSAVFPVEGRLAFTTDSYVVNPLFFPGGDIGRLAVCGTVNDLSMSGARPLYLSLALIIEEGLAVEDLENIMKSIRQVADEAGIAIATGDTKVVNKGSADKLFITTAGVGIVPSGITISGANARPGDKVILSGPVGNHGIAVLSSREGLQFSSPVKSDCAPLNAMVARMLEVSRTIRCLRDPTRGGLATTLNELARQSNVGIRIYEDAIPVDEAVRGACEMLGFDPLYVANEGKLIAIVNADESDIIIDAIKKDKYGQEAAVIGEVTEDHRARVTMKTAIGATRIVDMLTGELLPRIC